MHKRNSKKRWNSLAFFSNEWILAIVPALVIIFLLPDILVKYRLELQRTSNREENKLLVFYHDMNKDGVKEQIDISNFYGKDCACVIWKTDVALASQFNLYGKVPLQYELTKPIFCDVTNDGCDDLFVFTQKEDSIFLNAIDNVKKKIILRGRLITTIGFGNGKLDFHLTPIVNHDLNGDGIPEIYFSIIGGFALYPRKLFAYDFLNDSLYSSIDTGSKLIATPIQENNRMVLVSTTSATDNCGVDFPFPYQDTCAWLFRFNDKLELHESPISFQGNGCHILGPIQHNEELHYLVRNEGHEKRSNCVFVTDKHGVVKDRALLPSLGFGLPFEIEQKGKIRYLQYCTSNNLNMNYEYNPNTLKFEANSWSQNLPYLYIQSFLLNNNKSINFFGYNYHTRKFELLLDKLNHIVPFYVSFDNDIYFSYFETNSILEGDIIALADASLLYIYLLSKNPFYPFRLILFFLIYLLSTGFIYLSKQLQKRQILKREMLHKKISELQLQLVNSQLDPHFTFNTLNTVSAKILKGEKFEAYDLMSRFARMMRSAMLFNNKDYWSLEEELNFATDYLSLMKERFCDLFNFSVLVNPGVDIVKIHTPRLLIQNFAENAIKHAFTDIDYPGQISINVFSDNKDIHIEITDNGIGREQAKINFEKSKSKSGKGLGLIQQQVEFYNSLNNTQISFKIEDAHETPKGMGTKVCVCIPKTQ